MSDFLNNVNKALRDERWDECEELWLDAIESESVRFEEFVKAAIRAAAAGQGGRVGSVFALLSPVADTMPLLKKRSYYEALVTCMPKDNNHRETLLSLYREEYGHRPGFDTYVKTANLARTPHPAEAIKGFSNMVSFSPGTFVYHRSGWGVGKIKDVLNLEGAAVIDFLEKPGHRVALDAIPQICTVLDHDDFRVLHWQDPDMLKSMANDDPVALIKSVLKTSKRPLALARIRECLVGTVFATGSWTKWWTKTRSLLKKDPGIAVTAKKTPEYFLLDGPEGIAASLERRVIGKNLKDLLRIIREASDETKTDDETAALAPFIAKLKKVMKLTDGPPQTLLETLLFLNHNEVDTSDLPTVHDILGHCDHPGDVINLLLRQDDQREVIDLLRTQDADGWDKLHTDLLLRSDDSPRKYLIELLQKDHRAEEIDHWAREIHRLPRKAPMFFLWLVRRVAFDDTELVPSLKGAKGIDVYLKAISLLNDFSVRDSHESTTELTALVKRYKQHLGGRPFKLLNAVVTGADIAAIRNVYTQIETSPAFSSTARQGLLAAILRIDSTVLATDLSKRASVSFDDSVIYSTDVGVDRKLKELEVIRNEKLPAVFKLIGAAAEFGDLSENAEFTSAIEERENLNRRAMEIQSQLDKVRQIDPTEASTEFVSLGSRVALLNTDNQERNQFSLLGPWDGGPEVGVISYQSPLGQALLDKKPHEKFSVKLPGGIANYVIESISQHSWD